MLKKLESSNHNDPYTGFFTIKRILPGEIYKTNAKDNAFGPLANLDHAFMKKGLKIRMHEHVNDEILSYVLRGTSYHKDSAGLEDAIHKGRLMVMNAGESFWHEEKAKQEDVEILQIFVRPHTSNLPPTIDFHDKPLDNEEWYVMAGPEDSGAPLSIRQNTYILDAHPKAGQTLDIPVYKGLTPFLYVMHGEVTTGNLTLAKYEAVTDLDQPLPSLTAITDTTLVLFFVNLDASMTLDGTISGMDKKA